MESGGKNMLVSLMKAARYAAHIAGVGLVETSPALTALVAHLHAYLDGDEMDAGLVQELVSTLGSESVRPDLWEAAAGGPGLVRAARVVPSPPDVEFVVRQLEQAAPKD